MKSIRSGVFLFFVLVICPIQAQHISREPATIALSIAGDDKGTSGINGVAVGWALTKPLTNVTISARLANGGGYAGGIAYLTRAIGPGTDDVRAVAIAPFELPSRSGFNELFVLFTGLNLSAGEYWLVLGTPRHGPLSFASWVVSRPLTVRIADNARYLGTATVMIGKMADYVPASVFSDIKTDYGYQLEVTGFPVRDRKKPARPHYVMNGDDAFVIAIQRGAGFIFQAKAIDYYRFTVAENGNWEFTPLKGGAKTGKLGADDLDKWVKDIEDGGLYTVESNPDLGALDEPYMDITVNTNEKKTRVRIRLAEKLSQAIEKKIVEIVKPSD